MKYLKQFVVILIFSFVGEILNYVIPLPIPASIYGIVLLFLCLEFHIIPESAVAETGMFLVEIMPIMFIPAAVGLLDSWEILKASWISYLIVTLVSTVIVMAVAGLVTQLVMNIRGKGMPDDGKPDNAVDSPSANQIDNTHKMRIDDGN